MDLEKVAGHFSKMAEDVKHNSNIVKFGGAFVIVPPDSDENVSVNMLLLGATDAADFWTLLKVRCEQSIREADDRQRAAGGFRR